MQAQSAHGSLSQIINSLGPVITFFNPRGATAPLPTSNFLSWALGGSKSCPQQELAPIFAQD